jgi:hypothetical protein
MKILLMYSQYIYSLILHTVSNKHLYNMNNTIHIYIYIYIYRYNNNLHLPIISLSKFNKKAYLSGIKVFNHLLEYKKNLSNVRKYFTSTLKRFLFQHSFYAIEEYFKYKVETNIKSYVSIYSKCVNTSMFLKSRYKRLY